MKNTNYHFNDWMKNLDDTRRLHSLFIPAKSKGFRILGFGMIRDLYKGYRCVKCNNELDYSAITKFLSQNPSEFVIVTGVRSSEALLYQFHPSSTLKSVRGKILYLRSNQFRLIEYVSMHAIVDNKIVSNNSKLGSNVTKESYFIDEREDYFGFYDRFTGIYEMNSYKSLEKFIKLNYE